MRCQQNQHGAWDGPWLRQRSGTISELMLRMWKICWRSTTSALKSSKTLRWERRETDEQELLPSEQKVYRQLGWKIAVHWSQDSSPCQSIEQNSFSFNLSETGVRTAMSRTKLEDVRIPLASFEGRQHNDRAHTKGFSSPHSRSGQERFPGRPSAMICSRRSRRCPRSPTR